MSENFHFVRDVIVQTITHDLKVSDETFRSEPPLAKRIELGNGLWVGPLELETVNAIFDACSPRGMNFNATRQFGYHYCFVREQKTPHTPSIRWDEDRRLQNCMDLSRLVHPTTIATHFSARLSYEIGKYDFPSMIVPGYVQGLGAFAWVNGPAWRNWLTESDAQELAKLIAVYDYGKLPVRLRRAMRHLLYASFTYHLDLRFTLVVTGLEALVNTNRERVAKQFKKEGGTNSARCWNDHLRRASGRGVPVPLIPNPRTNFEIPRSRSEIRRELCNA